MFLVRPPAQCDESLSSWRQRLAMANGFRLFPLAPGELRRMDPDVAPPLHALQWVAQTHGSTPEQISRMTAIGRYGTTQNTSLRGSRRWIVSMQYSRIAHRRYGLPYCPECLREDSEPYFRLHWRSCLHSHCLRHGTLFQETCSRCQTAAWPGLCVKTATYALSWSAPHICSVCSMDLRDAAPGEFVGVHPMLVRVPSVDETIALSDSLRVTARSYGDAVWVICQLFIRTRSASRIAQHHATLIPLLSDLHAQSARCAEELPIQLRHRLTTRVHGLFAGWPSKLANFCNSARVSAAHLSQDRKDCPGWFDDFVRQHLCMQIRGISVDQVRTVSQRLSASGQSINKSSVSRALGVSSSLAIDLTLGNRTQASNDESLQFLRQLSAWCEVSQRRRSSTEVRIRDALILLLSILKEIPPAEVANWTKSACLMELARSKASIDSSSSVTVAYLNQLTRLMTSYDEIRAAHLPESPSDLDIFYFRGFRGSSVSQRSLQRTLSTAMKSLDPLLLRSTSVYWR